MSENVFNMSGLYSLKSESKGETISFGAFNGAKTISVFRSNGQKGSNIQVSNEFFVIICDTIADVLKGAPNAAFPIRRFKFDMQNKKKVLDSVLTIGKDSNGIFYIEFKDGDNAPLKFPFLGSKYIEAGPDGDGDRSFRAFKGFSIFVTREWGIAPFFTRNNLQKFGQNSNKGNSSKPSSGSSNSYSSGANMASEDDLY